MEGLIYAIVVGLIAGWLAGQVMKGGGYGVVVDIILGILGGIVGRQEPFGFGVAMVFQASAGSLGGGRISQFFFDGGQLLKRQRRMRIGGEPFGSVLKVAF